MKSLLVLSAFSLCSALQADSLNDSLTFYASFDRGINADFSKGDKSLFTRVSAKKGEDEVLKAGIHTAGATHIAPAEGRVGNALRFNSSKAPWLFFKGEENVHYSEANWSGSVSLWLRLDPEEDLDPGYCDPLQITTRQWNDGAFFVDFNKEGDPRDFRLGAFADLPIWNPDKKEVPESERPLATVKNPPFDREKWTHVAFTWEKFNTGQSDGMATFYLNGEKKGTIKDWNQQFTWKKEEQIRIYLGLNYIGYLDDLACFDRALTESEVKNLHGLPDHMVLTGESGAPVDLSLKKAFIDGNGPGWRPLGEKDFVNVNCNDDTWRWKDGVAHCTGKPVGVIRTQEQVKNFELVAEWMHKESGGNSGVFVWASPASIKNLEAGKGRLPHGIEVQVLDLGYADKYTAQHKKAADWFTSHGDVFPTGPAKMKPFAPIAPNGARSFPSKNLTKGINEWNHYYIRAINGEVRLWVNGEEVSGGTQCDPPQGYLCLESEGAPVVFRNIRLRELP